jgi:hypothetical protein
MKRRCTIAMVFAMLIASALVAGPGAWLAAASPPALARAALSSRAFPDPSVVDAEWVELAPPVRRGHSAILDPVGDRMLVFGGGQMWALALGGGGWSRVNPAGDAPSEGLAVYDPVRRRMLVGAGSRVWSLTLDADPEWSESTTSGSPPHYLALLHDPGRDRLLAFSAQLEVWQLPLAGPLEWTPLVTSGAPAGPRTGFSAIYDAPRDRVLVYGGHVPSAPPCEQLHSAANDVWALPLGSDSAWQRLPVPPGPATGGHTAVYDPAGDRMVIFGGHEWERFCYAQCDCIEEPRFSEVGCVALSLSPEPAWTSIDAAGGPHDRAGHSAIYDPVRGRMVIYGGWYENCHWCWGPAPADFSDATALVFGAQDTWQPLAVGAPPGRVHGSRAVYVPSGHRMLVHGGRQHVPIEGGLIIGERVVYDLTTETPTDGYCGPSRAGSSIVVDPIRNRLLLFGGYFGYPGIPGEVYNDTWVADLGAGTPWETLTTSGIRPAPREYHTAVFDPFADRMLVHGGWGYFYPPDRSWWSLQFGGAPEWTETLPASPFESYGTVLDPDGRRLVSFGNQGEDDVWTLPLDPEGAWARLSPSGAGPVPGSASEAIFDSRRHRVVVNRQWALSLGPDAAWTSLRIQGTGPTGGAAVYDPIGDGVVVCTDGAASFWALRFRSSPPVTVEFDFDPNTLNPRSMGRWVTGYLEPPEPFTPDQFVLASIRLNGIVPVDTGGPPVPLSESMPVEPDAPATIGDHDRDGKPDLAVKFSRAAVQLVLAEGDHVPVTATGMLGSRDFFGRDTVRVKRAKVLSPHAGERIAPRSLYTIRWEVPRGLRTQWVAVFHSFDPGNPWKLDGTHLPNTGEYAWAVPDTFADSARVAVVLVQSGDSSGTLVDGVLGVSDPFTIQGLLAVEPTPAVLAFDRIQPNPARGVAKLRFGLPRRAPVSLDVFDVQGRRVRSLATGEREAGWHRLEWRGEGESGERVGSGVYYLRLVVGDRELRQPVVWLR